MIDGVLVEHLDEGPLGANMMAVTTTSFRVQVEFRGVAMELEVDVQSPILDVHGFLFLFPLSILHFEPVRTHVARMTDDIAIFIVLDLVDISIIQATNVTKDEVRVAENFLYVRLRLIVRLVYLLQRRKDAVVIAASVVIVGAAMTVFILMVGAASSEVIVEPIVRLDGA